MNRDLAVVLDGLCHSKRKLGRRREKDCRRGAMFRIARCWWMEHRANNVEFAVHSQVHILPTSWPSLRPPTTTPTRRWRRYVDFKVSRHLNLFSFYLYSYTFGMGTMQGYYHHGRASVLLLSGNIYLAWLLAQVERLPPQNVAYQNFIRSQPSARPKEVDVWPYNLDMVCLVRSIETELFISCRWLPGYMHRPVYPSTKDQPSC